ncbi:hypothetical protein E2562_009446 [Oryza meyeriana var. granulata]|uniref:Uncharacterized protein n=1 Tax=Oryza meyeriana var. granulata TaxID=110450 RepID=A0A6G1BTE3_9ORYZ|nr:hypothetical protein E2562_009446 [Oryza meyeriana var. granulata]
MDDGLVCDVNWAPESYGDQDGMEADGCEQADAVADSERHAADVVEEDSDDVRIVVDSMAGDTEVPDSRVVVCVEAEDISPGCNRCGRVHGEEWWCSCRRFVCSRCGLIHRDYMMTSWIYGLDEFDREVLLPNLDALEMDGNVIVLPWKEAKMGDDVVKLPTQNEMLPAQEASISNELGAAEKSRHNKLMGRSPCISNVFFMCGML